MNLMQALKWLLGDSTSLHPAQAVKLPDVGYMRMLNAEGVLSMRPTLVLASELAKPSMALSQIEKSGVKSHQGDW
ncbi:Hemin-binding periplasmic protein hmuT precursor [Providencia stuartii]|nr:Hemin-binding periplasmic protein hmuT precursor [Providencia stuartii]